MTRTEFLTQLRMALQGNVSQAEVNEHLKYYENYIIEESRKGRSEQEVIDSLGEPRLIARTLIDTSEHVGNAYDESYYEEPDKDSERQRRGLHIEQDSEGKWDIRYGRFRFHSWYAKLLLIIILLMIVIILGHVMLVLLPIAMIIAAVSMVIRLIMGKKR